MNAEQLILQLEMLDPKTIVLVDNSGESSMKTITHILNQDVVRIDGVYFPSDPFSIPPVPAVFLG
jgi:hypothetical protein